MARRLQGIALAASVAATICAIQAATAGAASTAATIYQAFTPQGSSRLQVITRSGYCWTGSSTAARRDAWRCLTGNLIRDPCFSSPRDPGIVLCPQGPWLNRATRIHLTKPLSRKYANRGQPSLRSEPWAIELLDGRRCLLSSGASTVIEGERLNYFCASASTEGLWGLPDRHTQPWTILVAPFQATQLHERVAIRHAWA
jgi:hypothetical protein